MAAAPDDVVENVPDELKQLARKVTKTFYSDEHFIVLDLIVHHPCIKEEDLIDLTSFDKGKAKTVLNQLKMDKFIKTKMLAETIDSSIEKHNYYFVTYSCMVNSIKYKLHKMQLKLLEMEKRSKESSSFTCSSCEKVFSDFDAVDLVDPFTGTMTCTHCHGEVIESKTEQSDVALSVTKFNLQFEPLFQLIKRCDEVKHELRTQEYTKENIAERSKQTASHIQQNALHGNGKAVERSHDKSAFDISVNIGENSSDGTDTAKEMPVWLKKSTVDPDADKVDGELSHSMDHPDRPSEGSVRHTDEEIMNALKLHEATVKPPVNSAAVRTGKADVNSVADSEKQLTVCGVAIDYDNVDDAVLARMTDSERDLFHELGQKLFKDYYADY